MFKQRQEGGYLVVTWLLPSVTWLTVYSVCIESKDYFHSISPVARLYQPQAVGFSACLDRLIVCDTILFLWAIYMIRCYGTMNGLCVDVVGRDFMLTEEKDQTNGV